MLKFFTLFVLFTFQGLNAYDLTLDCDGQSSTIQEAKIVVKSGFKCEQTDINGQLAYTCYNTEEPEKDLLMRIKLTESHKKFPETVAMTLSIRSPSTQIYFNDCLSCNSTDLANVSANTGCKAKKMYLDEAYTRPCSDIPLTDLHEEPFTREYIVKPDLISTMWMSRTNILISLLEHNELVCTLPVLIPK